MNHIQFKAECTTMAYVVSDVLLAVGRYSDPEGAASSTDDDRGLLFQDGQRLQSLPRLQADVPSGHHSGGHVIHDASQRTLNRRSIMITQSSSVAHK